MSRSSIAAVAALIVEIAALAILALAVSGVSWLDTRSMPRVLVLADRSLSMPRQAVDAAIGRVTSRLEQLGPVGVQVLEFAGKTRATAGGSREIDATLQPSTTNIELALEAALQANAETRYSSAIVISDGFENSGDAARALRAAREAHLPVNWVAIGRTAPPIRISDVLVPAHAVEGGAIPVSVQLVGRLNTPVAVTVTVRDPSGALQTASAPPDAEGRVALEFEAKRTGALVLDVALQVAGSGERLDIRRNAAAVDVTSRGDVLYVQGSPGSLSRSLLEGGWLLNAISARRADAYADELRAYKAVVLDDVALGDAGAQFWSALVRAVQNDGLGLVVLGGERSFTSGGYRNSELESVLPVLSEGAALEQPASVVFVVDKSGSMGESSGGVDAFRLAQRAVLETARTFSDRDAVGLVVFDVEARVLIPLAPARMAMNALARDWPAGPRGGTKLGPALDAAIRVFDGGAAGRRILILVTDGFVGDAPIGTFRDRLGRAHVETIALAVGRDADMSALEALAGDAGTVLRVNEAAELPRIMRSGLERRRGRTERGAISVTQRAPLPFARAVFDRWPSVAAYSVTRSRPDAVVPVQSERGDPLIAFHTAGRGRVIAVTCGLGRWTPQWVRWSNWPRLAGGLVEWASNTPSAGALGLRLSRVGVDLRIDADARASAGWGALGDLAITATTPSGETHTLATDNVAPGRISATLPGADAGLYTFVLSSSAGTQRLLHLNRHMEEDESWGTSHAIDEWQRAGLLRNWDDGSVEQLRSGIAGRRDPDRWLIGLALVLFLTGVLIDRIGPRHSGERNASRRPQSRARSVASRLLNIASGSHGAAAASEARRGESSDDHKTCV
jgi:uncharacterized membrane protein